MLTHTRYLGPDFGIEMRQLNRRGLHRIGFQHRRRFRHSHLAYSGTQNTQLQHQETDQSVVHVWNRFFVSRIMPVVGCTPIANSETSACVTSIVRLKYLIDFRNSLDSTCKFPFRINTLEDPTHKIPRGQRRYRSLVFGRALHRSDMRLFTISTTVARTVPAIHFQEPLDEC